MVFESIIISDFLTGLQMRVGAHKGLFSLPGLKIYYVKLMIEGAVSYEKIILKDDNFVCEKAVALIYQRCFRLHLFW